MTNSFNLKLLEFKFGLEMILAASPTAGPRTPDPLLHSRFIIRFIRFEFGADAEARNGRGDDRTTAYSRTAL